MTKIIDKLVLKRSIIDSQWYMHADLHECGGLTITAYYSDPEFAPKVNGKLETVDEGPDRTATRVKWRRTYEVNADRVSGVLNPQHIFSYGKG